MRYSIDRCFHPTRPAGLHRLARIVKPDIASLDEKASDMKNIVVDARHPSRELRVWGVTIDSLDASFARLVGRMGFAGKNELNGPSEHVQKMRETVLIVKDQFRALVVCEPSRKSDCESRRIQQRSIRCKLGSAGLLLNPTIARTFANECEKMDT